MSSAQKDALPVERKRRNKRSVLEFSPARRALLYCSAFVVTLAGLRAAASIAVPLLLAVFFSIVCAPLLHTLQRRMPFPLALSLIMLLLVGTFMAVLILVGGSL